ncbi:hypothetical protein [uncultured Cardiobacterium sp.]|nr:hypothetical protein [uncultured Cardiobacterium sp.]
MYLKTCRFSGSGFFLPVFCLPAALLRAWDEIRIMPPFQQISAWP